MYAVEGGIKGKKRLTHSKTECVCLHVCVCVCVCVRERERETKSKDIELFCHENEKLKTIRMTFQSKTNLLVKKCDDRKKRFRVFALNRNKMLKLCTMTNRQN